MIVDAVEAIADTLDVSMVGVKKVPGGSVTESMLVKGVAFRRTFSYAGFEQQPKKFVAPKILLLNLELELKSEKENVRGHCASTHTRSPNYPRRTTLRDARPLMCRFHFAPPTPSPSPPRAGRDPHR